MKTGILSSIRLSRMNKNLKILIFSFIFALALWLYIELNLSYSLDIAIPVEVQTSKSQALSEEIPSTIDVRVKGKGWDLLNMLISKNIKYNIDITKMKRDTRIATQQFVDERLNIQPSVSILGINPDTININFDNVSTKVVPVRDNIVMNLKEGYVIVGNPELNPDSVDVQGAGYLINKIKYIPSEVSVFNNVNSDIEGFVNLKDTLSNLVNISTKRVNFRYNVQLSAEKNFEAIDVTVLNVPEDKEVLLIPPKMNLSLRGGVDQLTRFSPNEIIISIEFGKIETDTLGFIIPEVKIPENVNILNMEPPKLQYIIKNKFQ